MKKIAWLGAVALAGVLPLAASAADTPAASQTAPGGKIHFVGTAVNAACAVDANSVNQEVQLGQVRTAKLTKNALSSSRIPFKIMLGDCDTSTYKSAAVSFTGTAATGYTNVLQAGEGSSAATGVGIQIFDSTGTAVTLGTPSSTFSLNNGNNELDFNASFYGTSDAATAGDASATANFNITYS